MSQWREQRNEQARRRLRQAIRGAFPAAVMIHTEARALVPPLPRLAIESYWRAHPLRADRLARALARVSGAPEGWAWRIGTPGSGRAASFRMPPTPYREAAYHRGPGFCCICGQAVYRYGWHVDLWGTGTVNARAAWHACCVAAWKLWTAPQGQFRLLNRIQQRKCAASGKRLLRVSDVDHRIPLFKVWRDLRETPWPALLNFWGFPNLQALNRPVHLEKSTGEARERASKLRHGPAVALG